MNEIPITVETVRQAQELFKAGDTHNKEKKFKEAIEAFKQMVELHPFEEGHLEELQKKLKAGSFKLQQECIAYMGCAAVHLNRMVQQLTEEEKDRVPIDPGLLQVFKEWQ